MYSISIQEEDFNLDEEMRFVESSTKNAGALVSFTGRVRGHDYEKPLSHLFLEYFPGVTEKEIASEVKNKFNIEVDKKKIILQDNIKEIEELNWRKNNDKY